MKSLWFLCFGFFLFCSCVVIGHPGIHYQDGHRYYHPYRERVFLPKKHYKIPYNSRKQYIPRPYNNNFYYHPGYDKKRYYKNNFYNSRERPINKRYEKPRKRW
ncbi:hypothetical protein C0583_05755 [Candidatus Parcubacteria bacterium]|nr:MAG: hypothetical protein C0583_05755 [Candidatus Parcubacteria bacterium]